MSKQGNISKQMGSNISRLIGIAQQVKAHERGEVPPQHSPQATWPKSSIEMTAALKKERDEARAARHEAEREAKSLKVKYELARRSTLANFSLADIEAELMRRLDKVAKK